MSKVVDITQPSFELQEREVFEYLVFSKDGSVGISTNKSSYFFATLYFLCAVDLSKLLNGKPTKHLTYGIEQNRVIDPETMLFRLCVDREKLNEALAADKITSSWPGVVEFLSMLREIHTSEVSRAEI